MLSALCEALKRGRRPFVFSLIEDKMCLMVVALDQNSLTLGIVDLHSTYVAPLAAFELDLVHGAYTRKLLIEDIAKFIMEKK